MKSLRERFLEYLNSENINFSINVELNDFTDDLAIITKEWINDIELGKESYEAKNTLMNLTREP